MEITEQQLSEAGGWQAMKAAREYVKNAQVADTKRDSFGYHGVAGLGKGRYKASLLVDERGRIEGKCSCGDARRGLICAHVLAVALQVLKGGEVKREEMMSAGDKVVERKGRGDLPPAPKGELHVSIMLDQLGRLASGGTVPVFFRMESGDQTLAQGVWEWVLGKGLHQVPSARLEGEDLAELARVGVGHVSWWKGASAVKFKDKLIIKSDLEGFFTSRSDFNEQSIDVELVGGCFYKDSKTGLMGFKVNGVEILIFTNEVSKKLVKELINNGKVSFSIKNILENTEGFGALFGDVNSLLKEFVVNPLDSVITLNIDGGAKRLLAQVEVMLGGGRSHALLDVHGNEFYPIQDDESERVFYVRNLEKERTAVRLLERVGLRQVQAGIWAMSGEVEILQFIAHGVAKLRQFFEVVEGDQYKEITRSFTLIRPQLKAVSTSGNERNEGNVGMDWLNLEVAYEADNGVRVSRNEVLRLIRSGQRQGRTSDGKRFVLDVEGCEDLEETLHDLAARFESGGASMKLRRWQSGVLTNFAGKDQIWGEVGELLAEGELTQRLGGLGERLRYYQRDGIAWMERLGRVGLGGLLADEMGLGKTVQTLGMIRLLLEKRENKKEPALVICPTSLLGNWRDEAAKFVPDLRVHVSHNAGRHEHWDNLHDYDIILTSYQLVVRDLDQLKQMMFTVVVMDEASYVRNAETATSKAVRELQRRACFALTGTPVENSVKDLWSIYEAVLPGYLPRKDIFNERYVKKLNQPDSAQAVAAMERLRRLVKPYLLRRTKVEVAKDLPSKLEQVVWCELSVVQKEVYTKILEEGREEIRLARRRGGQGSARMTMFTVLLRLRQVCNDLRLLGMEGVVDREEGKWGRFDEMVQELVEGGHRALVFSQFVGMLQLVKDRLGEAGIEYCYLDGATRDRAEQVAEFQKEGSGKRFFLISLKAGGYGLNLTAADHVLLMDPWWNPAVEAQAIDRAHRIGQVRPVTAMRFVMRGTVEEKILKLQEKKRAVMDMAMSGDVTVMSGVTDEELEAMLEG